MKHNKKLAFPIFISLSMALGLLSGCTIGKLDPSASNTSSESQSEGSSSQHTSSENASSQGSSSQGGSSQSGSSNDDSSGGGGDETVKTVTIYASNDMHGAIEASGENIGLKSWGTYGKRKGDEPNTLLIDSGDTWQGSLYSNMNRGNVIQDIMCYMGYDARSVGNHDFDWGLDAIRANSARTFTYGGKTYSVPTLAANVYDYNFNTKQFGTTQQSDIGGKTVSYTLDNGLTVGIVGLIGSDQITSINSLYTHDIGFKDHIQTIKDEAANLRAAGCDLVICSIHAGIAKSNLYSQGLGSYVDLLLGAHTHASESFTDTDNPDVHMYQFACNTQMFGKVTLTYDTEQHKVTNTEMEILNSSSIQAEVGTNYDPVIANLIDTNKQACDVTGSEVLANNVLSLPPTIYDYGYVVDTYDSTIYKKQDGKWVFNSYISPTHGALDTDWHMVYGITESECINGHYYVDLNDSYGSIYYYDGDLNLRGSVTGGESSSWMHDNYHNVSFTKTSTGANIMAKAVLDAAISEGYSDVAFSYVNEARSNLTGTSWTWANIYEAFPFDNVIYIIEVSGKEIVNEIKKYNNICFSPTYDRKFDMNSKYKVACLDYLAFHTNSSRYYDYFPDNNGAYIGTLSKNYREILRDWLKANGYNSGKLLTSGEFASSVDEFNKENFINVTKCHVTFKMNDGTDDNYTDFVLNYDTNLRSYLPSDPERSGYNFGGWYLNYQCTGMNLVTSNYYVKEDITLYAKWTSNSVTVYETGQLTYTTFEAGTTMSYANATYGSNTPILVTFEHSTLLDKSSFSQFGIPNGGYIYATVPSGYKISAIEVSQYSNHPENLTFYDGINESGTELYKNYSTGSGTTIYNIEVNSNKLYIAETNDSYSTSINYISVAVVRA